MAQIDQYFEIIEEYLLGLDVVTFQDMTSIFISVSFLIQVSLIHKETPRLRDDFIQGQSNAIINWMV